MRLFEKLSTFSEYWSPKFVSQFNGNDVVVMGIQCEFVWHSGDDTDGFFLVLDGIVMIETEQGSVTLKPGEPYVVPNGVQHRPAAKEKAHILLIEPKGTPNTGDAKTAAQKVKL